MKLKLIFRLWQQVRDLNQRVYDMSEKLRDIEMYLITEKKRKKR